LRPALAQFNAAIIATIVLPEPTSPCKRRLVGRVFPYLLKCEKPQPAELALI